MGECMNETQKIQGHLAATREEVESQQGIAALICHNLTNFAYRYISTAHDPAPVASALSEECFIVESIETDLVSGLKLGGSELKEPLIAMAKSVGKGATIGQRLVVETKDYEPNRSFRATLRAQVSWDHPHHDYREKYKERVLSIDYEDALDMRNRLALGLEEICAFF